MENKQNPEFLRKKYSLHESEEVKNAVRRKEARTGEAVESTPEARIQNYLDRFKEILDREDPSKRERGIEAMKRLLHRELIIKPDVATDVYLKHQQRMGRQRGHGDVDIPEHVSNKIKTAVELAAKGGNLKQELKGFSNQEKQMAEEIVARIDEQKHMLNYWVDYLSGPDALYPDWLKYWAMRSITELSAYDKDEKRFPKRLPDTINSFPDLNQQALANVLDEVEKNEVYRAKLQALKDHLQPKESRRSKKEKQRRIAEKIAALKEQDPGLSIDRKAIVQEVEEELGKASFVEHEEVQTLRASRMHVDEALQTFLDSGMFAELYAQELEKLAPIDESMLANTNGRWVKYDQGSDHMILSKSLQPYNTGWCTAGETTAESQLSRGDFYVYYSEDEDGEFTIPRSAIRMEGDKIAEVRGIAKDQNLDPYVSDIVNEKMDEFPDGKAYQKKAADMKRVTDIDKKVKAKTQLTKGDLRFLYEIDNNIEGFGYQKDPRIKEILDTRIDKRADLAFVLSCAPEAISFSKDEALQGGIKFHYGDLYLNRLTSAEGLTLPESVGGDLYLNSLTSAEGLTLPASVGGDLSLSGLTSAEGLTLPSSVGGDLYLSSLTSAEGLTLPASVGGGLYLRSLTAAEKRALKERYGLIYKIH